MAVVYDVAVIGGGPGGYIAAQRAGEAGLSAVLFEGRALGGTCLNEGCIPTKTLLHAAKLCDIARGGGEACGVTCTGAALDHPAVLRRKDQVVSSLVGGVSAQLRRAGVTVVAAAAEITGRSGEGFEIAAGGEVHCARRLILATGSRTAVPPIPGLAEGLAAGTVLTSRELLSLPAVPPTLTVVGAGVIGLEMAAYYHSVGSRVTVVEMAGKVAGAVDGELSALLQREYEARGVTFHLGAQVTEIRAGEVLFQQDGAAQRIAADRVLLAIGRRPVTDGCGLERLGVDCGPGGIDVDDFCRTSIAGVYAVGDCTGRSLLAHTAYRQGEVAVKHILGGRDDPMRYDAIPHVLYTHPEVAGVGLTEALAAQRGIPVEVVRLPMGYSGRYQVEHPEGGGLCKLLFHKSARTLVGAHLLGGPASEIILACGMMVALELTAEEIRRQVFPHPAVCEIVREAAFALG